jgi:hypothetical protein
MYLAFWKQRAFRDCVISGKWQYLYAGGASPELIFHSADSRRFYSVNFEMQGGLLGSEAALMASVWKWGSDGYRRMLGYRRKVGTYRGQGEPRRWYDVRVECIGPETIVYFEDNFVLAVRDDEYAAGLVGVGSTYGQPVWKDLVVQGTPVELKPPWSVAEAETPKQVTIVKYPDIERPLDEIATLLPDDEILVGYKRKGTHWVTRSRDAGLNWDAPMEGRSGTYLKSLDEVWLVTWENRPGVEWHDRGTNFDELTMENFWDSLRRSRDGGRTWSKPEPLNVPFPAGKAYAPIKGKAGSVLICYSAWASVRELSDGSIAMTGYWRNSPDGTYASDQVQFLRTTDGGKSWSISPVDATEWERNESSWVELDDGELLCVMRSNYQDYLGVSRSRDMGKTWSRVQPSIPFFGSSCPALIRTSRNVLVLAVRGWGLFTSVDNGHTWSEPTAILGYHGSGSAAQLLEMSDGRVLIIGGDDVQTIKAQFINVDSNGVVHPALPGPMK